MKTLTFAATLAAGLAFAVSASACPFSSKSTTKSADAPILKPAATGS